MSIDLTTQEILNLVYDSVNKRLRVVPTVHALLNLQAGKDYYHPHEASGARGTRTPGVNIYFSRVHWPGEVTYNQLIVEVLTAAVGGTQAARLGLYNDGGVGTIAPGTLLLDAGSVATDATGVKRITSLSQVCKVPWTWHAIKDSNSPTTQAVFRAFKDDTLQFGGENMGANGPLSLAYASYGYLGSLPNPAPAVSFSNDPTLIGFRLA